MSATYLTNNGLVQYTGIITDVQLNNLGSLPYTFDLPGNFVPFNFIYTVISGITQPVFLSDLVIYCISTSRNMFIVKNVTGINFYYLSSYNVNTSGTPPATGSYSYDIELLPNNFQLIPLNGLDPTPGDYFWKYTFTGFFI